MILGLTSCFFPGCEGLEVGWDYPGSLSSSFVVVAPNTYVVYVVYVVYVAYVAYVVYVV